MRAAELTIIASAGGKFYEPWQSSHHRDSDHVTFAIPFNSRNANRFHNFTEMQESLVKLGGEMMESEDGELPKFIDAALPVRKWTFITIMRYPLDRLVSSVKYDLKSMKNSRGPLTRDQLYKATLHMMNISIKKCKSQNYYTRVFSHTCRCVSYGQL